MVKACMIALTLLYAIFIYPGIVEGRSFTIRQVMFITSLPYVFAMWWLIKAGARAWEKEQSDQQNKR
jgi:hypothetical protein